MLAMSSSRSLFSLPIELISIKTKRITNKIGKKQAVISHHFKYVFISMKNCILNSF